MGRPPGREESAESPFQKSLMMCALSLLGHVLAQEAAPQRRPGANSPTGVRLPQSACRDIFLHPDFRTGKKPRPSDEHREGVTLTQRQVSGGLFTRTAPPDLSALENCLYPNRNSTQGQTASFHQTGAEHAGKRACSQKRGA